MSLPFFYYFVRSERPRSSCTIMDGQNLTKQLSLQAVWWFIQYFRFVCRRNKYFVVKKMVTHVSVTHFLWNIGRMLLNIYVFLYIRRVRRKYILDFQLRNFPFFFVICFAFFSKIERLLRKMRSANR